MIEQHGDMTRADATRRILIVGLVNSVHLQRWVRMAQRPDTAILLFPSLIVPYDLPPDFRPLGYAEVNDRLPPGLYALKAADIRVPPRQRWRWRYRPLTHSFADPRALATPERVIDVVDAFKPHLVHAHETQMAGYVCSEAARRMGRRFPPFFLSNWGSDIYFYSRFEEHRRRIRDVLSRVSGYMPDCRRDLTTARSLGYKGPDVDPMPASGGQSFPDLADMLPPSRRRLILVKGYHNWVGRALLALSAVTLAKEHLRRYVIGVVSASPRVATAARELGRTTGLAIEVMPYLSSHEEAARRFFEARLALGVSISDGLPTTVLEAMAGGAFPIQSSTSCVDEWLEHGRTGLIVSPHDTREIADALIRAATDDALVDAAAPINMRTVHERWNAEINARRLWEIYERFMPAARAER